MSMVGSVIAVAGGAGSGKTTLGRALSSANGAVLIDLDAATADFVAREAAQRPELSEAELLREIRDARYVNLLEQVREARLLGDVIVAAPFTAEIASADAWAGLVAIVGGEPVHLVWIEVTPAERLRRMKVRGASRDAHLLDGPAAPPVAAPVVPHLRVDARGGTGDKVALVMSHFGNGSR